MALDELRLFLESARDAHLKCVDLRERVWKLESTVMRITANLDGMPKGGNADKERALSALADARSRLLLDVADEEQRKVEISDFIDRVPIGAAARSILRRRYLHYESWKGVRRWLSSNRMNYSAQSVYRLHGEAIRAARELWDREHNDS